MHNVECQLSDILRTTGRHLLCHDMSDTSFLSFKFQPVDLELQEARIQFRPKLQELRRQPATRMLGAMDRGMTAGTNCHQLLFVAALRFAMVHARMIRRFLARLAQPRVPRNDLAALMSEVLRVSITGRAEIPTVGRFSAGAE